MGEIVAAVGGILLFVFLFFFAWYGVGGAIGGIAESLGVKATVNGWHGHSVLRWLMLLTIIAALGLAFLTATQRTVALPVTAAVITTAIAALTTVLLAYRVIINEPGPNQFIDVKIGAWLGLVATAVVTYGGYLAMREEGTSLSDAREQARAAGQQARSAFEGATQSQGESGGSAPPPPPGAAAPPAPAAAPPDPPAPPPAASEPTYPSETTAPSETAYPADSTPEEPPANAAPPAAS